MSNQALIQLRAVVGEEGYLCDPSSMAPYLTEQRQCLSGRALAILFPRSTQQVAQLATICCRHGLAIVPQGGNTSLVGGAIPWVQDGGIQQIVINLSRLNRIRAVDDDTLTAESGCVLQDIRRAAETSGRCFPLGLSVEDVCQIGGCLSSNAGGTLTCRYGTARDLVLGLEVVLPDGRIWEGLRQLYKDNAGYHLRHLFLGAEGTLGIITAAVLKLFPEPEEQITAFMASEQLSAVLELVADLRRAFGYTITACELIPRLGIELAIAHVPGAFEPLPQPHRWYILLEIGAYDSHPKVRELFLTKLESVAHNARAPMICSTSRFQAERFWFLRRAMVRAQQCEGASLKHDIAVPRSQIARFLDRTLAAISQLDPTIRPMPFGHIIDGSIHFNLTQPKGGDPKDFMARQSEIEQLIHRLVLEFGGTISAEHGIGQVKAQALLQARSQVEIDLMRTIKHALDPGGVMNPGKILLPEAI